MSRSKRLIAVLALAALIAACILAVAFYGTQAERAGPAVAWEKTFDNGYYDYGSMVRQTSDGGLVVTGGASPAYKGDRDALLVRTDSNGSLQWQRLYGGSDFDYGYDAAEASGGGFAVAGVTWSGGNGSGDVYLVRTDERGNPLWEKTFGGSGYDEGRSLLVDSDGGFVIAGVAGTRDNGSDIYLVRTDVAGNVAWERTYGGKYDDLALSIEPASDGGYIVGGYYGTGAGSGEGYLLKVDARGRPIWGLHLPGEDGVVYRARQTGDKGYVAAGYTNFSAGKSEIRLSRVDHNGSLLWQKAFGGDGTMKGYDVFVAPDGGYVILGEAGPGRLYQGLLIKTDAGGNEEYRHTYGSARDVFVRSGAPTTDGAMVLAGSAGDRDDVETWDVCLIKTGRL